MVRTDNCPTLTDRIIDKSRANDNWETEDYNTSITHCANPPRGDQLCLIDRLDEREWGEGGVSQRLSLSSLHVSSLSLSLGLLPRPCVVHVNEEPMAEAREREREEGGGVGLMQFLLAPLQMHTPFTWSHLFRPANCQEEYTGQLLRFSLPNNTHKYTLQRRVIIIMNDYTTH